MSKSIETITPKKAAEWLRHNNHNRPLSDKWSTELARRMNDGEWKMNGETIKFNCDGGIVDGQHRLQAIVKSGRSIKCYVVRGIQSDAFDTIDIGKIRTRGDMLARDGVKHYNCVACACVFLFKYEHGTMRSSGSSFVTITPTIVRNVLDTHPGIIDAVQVVLDWNVYRLMSGGHAAALLWLMRQKDHAAADKFFESLATGENLSRSNPVLRLRERLKDNRSKQAKVSPVVVAAFVIKTWNAIRAGKPLGIMRWTQDEDFPEVK